MKFTTRETVIAGAAFMAGSFAQLYYDKWNVRRKMPQLLDRYMPPASKMRAAQVHNLHVENSQRLVEELANMWVEFLDDEIDTEELAKRNRELQENHAMQLEFIKQIVVG